MPRWTSALTNLTSTDAVVVTVDNVTPLLVMTGDPSVEHDATYTLNLISNDPGDDTISEWLIDWGDGNIEAFAGDPTSVTHVYAVGPATRSISATVTDKDGCYVLLDAVSVNVTDNAPEVDSFQIAEGADQRSTVNELTLWLDKDAQIDPQAFSVTRIGNGGGPVGSVSPLITLDSDRTKVVLSFAGENTQYDGLIDGNYQLRIDASKVTFGGEQLNGAGTGPGADYVDEFFRFYGDSDGDRDVDGQDYGNFGRRLLRRLSP